MGNLNFSTLSISSILTNSYCLECFTCSHGHLVMEQVTGICSLLCNVLIKIYSQEASFPGVGMDMCFITVPSPSREAISGSWTPACFTTANSRLLLTSGCIPQIGCTPCLKTTPLCCSELYLQNILWDVVHRGRCILALMRLAVLETWRQLSLYYR